MSHNTTNHDTSTGPRTRQQRAALVSDELRALNRDNSDTSTDQSSDTSTDQSSHPSIQSSANNPDAIGASSSTNNSNKAFGPESAALNNQSIRPSQHHNSHLSRYPEADKAVQALLNKAERYEKDLEEKEDDEFQSPSTQHELVLLEQFDKQDITPVPFEHEPVTKEAYLRLGQNGATIAAGNLEGVLEDRLRLLAEPTQDGFRWPRDIAKRMLKGQFVSFESEEEKAAVLAAAEKVNTTVKKEKRVFAPVATSSQGALVDSLIRGKYADPKATPYKQAVLNDVARYASNNGTYLADDQSKLIRKIRSLLPAEGVAARRPAPKKS